MTRPPERARASAPKTSPEDPTCLLIYRVVLGLTMLPMLVLFGLGLYFRATGAWNFAEEESIPGFLEHIALMVSWELHVAFFICSVLAVIWAVATPKWVERVWDKAADHALALIFWMVALTTIYGWLS